MKLFLRVLFLLFFFAVPLLRSGQIQAAGADNNIFWNELGHNSRDPLYRNPGGAVPTGTPVKLRLRAASGDLTAAQVRVWNDRINTSTLYNMTKVASDVIFPGDPTAYEFWEVTLPGSPDPTVYWYRFIAIDGTDTDYYEDDANRTGGWGTTYEDSVDNSWQLTIYDPAFQTPDWVKNAVIYQIFPDRFRNGNPANDPAAGQFFYGNYDSIYRSNDTEWNTAICDPRNVLGSNICNGIYSQNFYGGDLQGIIDQLDYLDSLGITAIYLNPIFESPSNHKYDTTDFLKIDDNFGDLATFQTLVAQAHARGINIILDGVFNHSSSDSYYFDRYSRWDAAGTPTPVGTDDDSGGCEGLTSPYADWYPFFTTTPPAPCSDNRDYPKWFGIFDSLPVFLHDNPEVRDYFINNGTSSVGPYWAQWADGWRLDVAPEIDHGTINDPSDDYWEDFRAAVRAVNPDMYIVGEEWGNATSWTIGGEWDATMNYQFSSAVLSFWRDTAFTDNDFNSGSSAGVLNPLDPSGFSERFLNLQERYAPEAFYAMMNLFGSHDTNRVLFLLDHNTGSNNTGLYASSGYDWSDSITRLKGAVLMQMTLPGAPTVYYGDEVGTVNPPAYDGSRWQDDPYNRVPYPWLDETGTPFYTHMQSASSQANLRDYYITLINARNANPALRTGSFDLLLTDNTNDILAYGRKLPDDSNAAVVVVNGSASVQNVTVDVSGYLPVGASLTDVLTGTTYTVNSSGQIVVNAIPTRSGVVLVMNGFSGRPAAVSNLAATAGNGSITLNWSPAANANSYDVYRSRLSGGGYSFVGNTTSTSYNDNTGLTNAVPYYYVVVSKNDTSLLESGYSNEATATPQYDLTTAWYNLQWPPDIGAGNQPQPLYVLSATTPTTTIYGQIWIDGATEADGAAPGVTAQVGYGPEADHPSSWTWFPMTFNAQVGNNDEYQGTLLPTSAGTFRYTTRWSADGGNTWYYTDKSGPPYDASDTGLLIVTPPSDTIPPAAPQNLAVTATTSTSVTLGWDTHPDTDGDLYGFGVWRQDTAAPGFTQIATITDPAATSYTDSTVTSGGNFDYYITAIDTSLNESDPSNTVNATAEMRFVNVTFTLTVPDPSPGTIYIVGNFNGWNPGDPANAMTQLSPTSWQITKSILDGTQLEYKFTRGSWEKVEKEADGNIEINNRTLTVAYGTNGTQEVNLTVANWRDPLVTTFSPADGASGLPDTTTVTFSWNQAMNLTTSGFSLTGPSGAVTGTLTYDSTSRTHTFTPDAALADGLYTATVSGNTDAGGDAQQVSTTWSFTVGTPNTPPDADAGDDATYTDSDNDGHEFAPLDGTGSTDSDGTIVSYVWTLNGDEIATGANPVVQLPVGVHTIVLTVTDDDSATDTDEVLVTVKGRPVTALTLTSVCSANPTLERRWRIDNSNSFAVEVQWEVVGAGQSGSLTAQPGSTYFTTQTVAGPNTTTISWLDGDGVEQSITKDSAGLTCTPPAGLPPQCANVTIDNVINGTNHSEIIIGTELNDLILAGNGADVVYSNGGDDCIAGGNGADVLLGGGGRDVLLGGNGNDILYGGDGDDTLYGQNGFDILSGGPGDDILQQ